MTSETKGDNLASMDPPATAGAFAPNLSVGSDTLLATWIEPVPNEGEEETSVHRVRFARFDGELWSKPSIVAEGSDHFANWADYPEPVESADGSIYVHWLAKTATGTYAYSPFVARSKDGGATWESVGKLNNDDTPTEHGFVSFVPEGDGVRAFWLDGRLMVDGGPMAVRSALVGETSTDQEILDGRVCECCSTDATSTSAGPIVVYRDRSEDEVRDIYAVRKTSEGWSEPVPVHRDGWLIEGCPVNGPVIDSAGDQIAVAWFTAAEERPRIELAFSRDHGSSFEDAIVVDDRNTLGRVDLVLDPVKPGSEPSAWLSWMATSGDHAEIRVQAFGSDGPRTEPRVVATTSLARASGFPVLERLGTERYLVWVELKEDRAQSRLRMARL